MRTERRFARPKDPYPWRYRLVFEDVDTSAPIDTSVSGKLFVTLDSDPSYPVELRLKDSPEEPQDAPYVTRLPDPVIVEESDDGPHALPFEVGAGEGGGAKFISMRTADFDPEADIAPKESPEAPGHHISIPPAQVVRLAHKFAGGTREDQSLQQLYHYYEEDDPGSFLEDIKSLVSFSTRVAIIDDLTADPPQIFRGDSGAVNTVAKQLTNPANTARVQSIGDLRRLIDIVDSRPNFGDVELEAVRAKVRDCHPEKRVKIFERLSASWAADTDEASSESELVELLFEDGIERGHIDRRSDAGHGIALVHGDEVDIGPVTEAAIGDPVFLESTDDESWERLTDIDTPHPDDTRQAQSADSVAETTESEDHSESESKGGVRSSTGGGSDVSTPSRSEQSAEEGEVAPQAESDDASSEKQADIESLREAAEEAGETDVTVTRRTTSTSEYSRSPKVREYAKARADGACEGCGDPAPFQSASGDPYLEAHHVEELSDGGADTPEMVIALCPKCHCRVHYGRDGEAYNRELKQRLTELEG